MRWSGRDIRALRRDGDSLILADTSPGGVLQVILCIEEFNNLQGFLERFARLFLPYRLPAVDHGAEVGIENSEPLAKGSRRYLVPQTVPLVLFKKHDILPQIGEKLPPHANVPHTRFDDH